jgi:hypothetical protein
MYNTIINLSLSIFKIQRRFSMWNLFQNTMTVAKPEFEDDGKLFSGYHNLMFKVIIVQSDT